MLDAVSAEQINMEHRAAMLLFCDHGNSFIPDSHKNLQLTDNLLSSPFSADVGAAALTRHMAELMGVSALLAPVSRLLVDCRSDPVDGRLVPQAWDRVQIPGNLSLSDEEMADRKRAYFDPYHDAAAAFVKAAVDRGDCPLLVSIASFPEDFAGRENPWHVGVSWNRDMRLAQAMIGLLERETDLMIGENEPFSGRDDFYTLNRHAGGWLSFHP